MLFLGRRYTRFTAGTGLVGYTSQLRANMIKPPPRPVPTVTADFEVAPLLGYAPLTVGATSRAVGVPPVTTHVWDFQNAAVTDATTASATYTYATPGVYAVRYSASNGTVTDEVIRENYVTVLEVPAPPPPSATITAGFVVSPAAGPAPLTVECTDTSTGTPTPNAWAWTRSGSGVTTTTQNVTYTFQTTGVKTISLTVTNGTVSDTITHTINVGAVAPPYVGSAAISGPSEGQTGVASTAYTVTLSGAPSGNVVFTPASTLAGTFSPTTLVFNAGATSLNLIFTPSADGAHSITLTNDSNWTNPAAVTYTASAGAPAAPFFDVTAANLWWLRLDPSRAWGSTQNYGSAPTVNPNPVEPAAGMRGRFAFEASYFGEVASGRSLVYLFDMHKSTDSVASGGRGKIDSITSTQVTANTSVIAERVTAPWDATKMAFLFRIDKNKSGWDAKQAATGDAVNKCRYHYEVINTGPYMYEFGEEFIIVFGVYIQDAWKTDEPRISRTLAQLHGVSGSAGKNPPWTLQFIGGGAAAPQNSVLQVTMRGATTTTVNGVTTCQSNVTLPGFPKEKTDPAGDAIHWIVVKGKCGTGVGGGIRTTANATPVTAAGSNVANPELDTYYAVGNAEPALWFHHGGAWGYPNTTDAPRPLDGFNIHSGIYWVLPTDWTAITGGATVVTAYNAGVFGLRLADRPTTTVRDCLMSVRGATVDVPTIPSQPPAAPGTLTISSVTGTGFAWDCADVSGATSYEAELHWYIDSNEGLNWFTPSGATSATSNGTITGLEAGMIYALRVRARNANGAGPWKTHTTFIATTFPTVPHIDTMGVLTTTTTRLTATEGQTISGRRFTAGGGVFVPAGVSCTIQDNAFEDCTVVDGNDSPCYCSGNGAVGSLVTIQRNHFIGCQQPIKVLGADVTNLTAGRATTIRQNRFSNMKWPTNKQWPLAQLGVPHAKIPATKPIRIEYNIFDGWGDGYTPSTVEGDTININRASIDNGALFIRHNMFRGGSFRAADAAKRASYNSATCINLADQDRPAGSTTPTTGAGVVEHNRFVWHTSAGVGKFHGSGRTEIRGNWVESPVPKTGTETVSGVTRDYSAYQTGNGITLFKQYNQPLTNTVIERNRINYRLWTWGNYGTVRTDVDVNPASLATANTISTTGNTKQQAGTLLTAQQLWEAGTSETWGTPPYPAV